MINANELRIGNLVSENSDNAHVLMITEISKNGHIKFEPIQDIEIPMMGGDIDIEVLPIPLTEEWLLKFGFNQNRNLFTKNRFNIDYTNNSFSFIICTYTGLDVKIKYVHQLQNLYFALTGEELTIK